ncbi:hypothetical protein A8713_22320 [Streptomyces sp. SAT1]|uniref:hypothetical protein n=1 Tax=Streptomyces sp. SAT1 TaxID=1849967 RepID=UPI0007DD55A3|nr:hypothetical protein [Streptomyces sp. SAT1]ANH93562.1 hypothetical protein A8713_22320 [Streptomyces sp. SAT1]
MGTRTADETSTTTGADTKDGAAAADSAAATAGAPATEDTPAAAGTASDAETAETGAATAAETADADAEAEAEADTEAAGPAAPRPAGVGQGAAAVVAAALGLVSLSGSWLGTVAGAREQLTGQLRTSTTASVATQIKEVYGDAWHTTALWGGLFALLALVVGVVVLARPAFGAPGEPQAPWIKSVAWAGAALGVLGLLLAVLKYTDVLLGLPSA